MTAPFLVTVPEQSQGVKRGLKERCTALCAYTLPEVRNSNVVRFCS